VVTASPVMVDGVAYVGDWSGHLFAISVAHGHVLWSDRLGDSHHGAYGVITSSAAVASGVAYVGAGDSLFAVDTADGHVRWHTDLDARHPTDSGEIESSPVVFDGVVYVGSDANQDSGYTGEGLWAISAKTGAPLWHFNPEVAVHHPLYGCGNVWSSPALDTTTKTLFFGTADCPDNSGHQCSADGSDALCHPGSAYDYTKRWSPLSEAIIAISAVDGHVLWSHQDHVPLNKDDDDYGASAQLFTLANGRKVVGEGNKDGSYTVLDRANGAVVWHAVEQGNGNVHSGLAIGGFLGATAVLNGTVYGGSAIDLPWTAHALTPFVAFAGATGARSWQAVQFYSYAPTTAANGVVYEGALDDVLRAYDASSGRLLSAIPLGAPISSGAAIGAGTLVIGTGTSETDLQFKVCDRLPALKAQCKASALNTTLNPLGDIAGIWGLALA